MSPYLNNAFHLFGDVHLFILSATLQLVLSMILANSTLWRISSGHLKYMKKTTTFIDMNTSCRTDSLYHHIRPQNAHVLGEDLVPEQENKMEKAGRGNEVEPWLRLLICTVDLKKIQNGRYIM